jgi:hypothetical protein
MAKALDMKSGGGNIFIRAMQRKGLGSELDQNLIDKINKPFYFKPLGLDLAHGYEAEVLVDVCKSIIRASEAGKLTSAQDNLAAQARILLNAFAKVGVTALVDEATQMRPWFQPAMLSARTSPCACRCAGSRG